MPHDDGREPQSYGSEKDWTTGETGQTVNRTEIPPPEHTDFYESRRESDTNGPAQGGLIQPEWTDHVDVLRPVETVNEVDDPAWKVSAEKSGARRASYFRKRDYE